MSRPRKKVELDTLREVSWQIALDPDSTKFEKLNALQLVAASMGVLLPTVDERWITAKQADEIRAAKQHILTSTIRKTDARRTVNRRFYLKRRVRELEEIQATHSQELGPEKGEKLKRTLMELRAELAALERHKANPGKDADDNEEQDDQNIKDIFAAFMEPKK